MGYERCARSCSVISDWHTHTPLKRLSRGTRMKAALLASLAYRPELLVLDEPFTGLDPLVRDELIRALLELPGETAVHGVHLVARHRRGRAPGRLDWLPRSRPAGLCRARVVVAGPVSPGRGGRTGRIPADGQHAIQLDRAGRGRAGRCVSWTASMTRTRRWGASRPPFPEPTFMSRRCRYERFSSRSQTRRRVAYFARGGIMTLLWHLLAADLRRHRMAADWLADRHRGKLDPGGRHSLPRCRRLRSGRPRGCSATCCG